MGELSIGVIGLGGAGRAHAFRFGRNRRVQRVVAYDPKQIRLPGIRTCASIDALLDEVDAVTICTPDSTHFAYIVECMQRGKHVLVEKPMVSNLDEAKALDAVIKDYPDVKFAIHHQMRFVPAFLEAKGLLEREDLGSVFYMEANYWHDMRARNRLYDDWRLIGDGQSVIFGAACHPLDLLLHLADSEVISHSTVLNKNAYTDFPGDYTSATTLLKFANGIVAKVNSNNCVTFPQMNNVVILGDKATYIDGVLYRNDKFTPGRTHSGISIGGGLRRKTIPALVQKLSLDILSKLRSFRQNPFSVYDHDHACQVVVDNFVDAVLDDRPVLVGYEDGLRVIGLCEETEAEGLAKLRGQLPQNNED